MKRLLLLATLALAGCSQPPQHEDPSCPPLPRPLGDTIAAVRAYSLVLIQTYATCAASRQN